MITSEKYTSLRKADEYKTKLFSFLFTDIQEIKEPNILEFGVRKGVSTKMFLELCKEKNGKLFSVDIDDSSKLFDDENWKFIHSRDDNFENLEKKIPNEFDVIYLDTLHTADHVEKILYYYYKKLKIRGYFIIDDISHLPYVKRNYRDNFHNEINNQETFERLLQIYSSNEINFDLSFSFIASGLAKIIKLNNNELNKKNILISRKLTFKNFVRKILNKINRN